MRFSTTTTLAVLLSLATSSFAAPIDRRATSCASTTAAVGGSVLKTSTYDDFQVSSGVGGAALAEVNANFPIDLNDLVSVSAADLAVISKAAQVSEQAEIATGGFNDAIAAAGGQSTTAGAALQVGKIKNKVLKLQTDVLRIMIEVAQGNMASASSLTEQQTKLATNVALDVNSKGKTATSISFAGND